MSNLVPIQDLRDDATWFELTGQEVGSMILFENMAHGFYAAWKPDDADPTMGVLSRLDDTRYHGDYQRAAEAMEDAEIFNELAKLIPPAKRAQVKPALDRRKARGVLKGWRGVTKADADAYGGSQVPPATQKRGKEGGKKR